MGSPYLFYRDLFAKHIKITKGEGVYIYDENGKRYLDATGGANASIPIGHGVKEIADAMTRQANNVSFVPMHLFSNEPAEELAEEIAKITPDGLKTTWFVNSGSEAADNAVKIARQYQLEKGATGKFKVITRWQSFFGNTLGALSVGGHTFRRSKYIPLLKDMPHIPPAYCYRCWFNREYPGCDIDCATFLERVIKQEGASCVAAFMAEPIVGATTGATVPPKEYYPIVREICDTYDIAFIVDEVQTGIGRTGKWFSIEHWNVKPDIITTAKGLSGGYTPLGAVIVSDNIVGEFRKNRSNLVGGHTFSANPISCAVGLAVLKYISSHNLVQMSRESGEYLIRRMRELQEKHPMIGDVRGLGLMIGLEFVRDRKTKRPFPPEAKIGNAVTIHAMNKGLILYPGTGTADGISGDHILLTPPYVITRDQMNELTSILDESLGAVEASQGIK
jgi:adenosylmethionine-8-amino-7-oxononanoate aminotransferase